MKSEDRNAIGLLAQALCEKEAGDQEQFESTIKTLLKDLGLQHMLNPVLLKRFQ